MLEVVEMTLKYKWMTSQPNLNQYGEEILSIFLPLLGLNLTKIPGSFDDRLVEWSASEEI